MNIHIFYDKLSVTMAEKTFRNFRFFADNLDSQNLLAQIQKINLKLPEGRLAEGMYEVPVDTPAGRLDPAFRIAQWLGPDYPTIIYHHGNNERPFDFGVASKNSFKNIFITGRQRIPANLIALRAPFHQDLRIYLHEARRLDRFAAMLATSVVLTEALIADLQKESNKPIIIAGVSLGGWVTNLHKVFFDSADAYVPMLSGSALAEVFISSIYKKLAGQNALNNPDQLRSVLNFEEAYSQINLDNVYPLLARHDQIIQFERQKGCYRDHPILVLEKGHTTASLAFGRLRQHVVDVLNCVTKK